MILIACSSDPEVAEVNTLATTLAIIEVEVDATRTALIHRLEVSNNEADSDRSEHPLIVEADAYLQTMDVAMRRSRENAAATDDISIFQWTTADDIRRKREILQQRAGLYDEFIAITPPDVFRTYHRYLEKIHEAYVWDRDAEIGFLDSFPPDPEQLDMDYWDEVIRIAGIIDNLETLSWSALDDAKWNLHESLDLPSEFGDGVFRVGIDIAAGVYHRGLGFHDECYWDIQHDDWIEVGADYLFETPDRKLSFTVELAPDDRAFFSIGCGAWERAFQ